MGMAILNIAGFFSDFFPTGGIGRFFRDEVKSPFFVGKKIPEKSEKVKEFFMFFPLGFPSSSFT